MVEATLRIFLTKPSRPYYPRYYFKLDPFAGYDIAKRFITTKHIFPDSRHRVWSNEIGCFDKSCKGIDNNYIILLGDSYVWGFTPFEYNYGSLLEKYLGYRVLKCGVPGYGTKQELIKLKKILKEMKNRPRLIIVSYCLENDFINDYLFPLYTVIDGFLLGKYKFKDITTGEREIIPDDKLIEKYEVYKVSLTHNIPTLEQIGINKYIRIWLCKHSEIYKILRQNKIVRRLAKKIGLHLLEPQPHSQMDKYSYECPKITPFTIISKYTYLEKAWEEHLRNLEELRKYTTNNGLALLIVAIPAAGQVYDFLKDKIYCEETRKDYDWGQPNRILQKYSMENNVSFLDLTPYFRRCANQTVRKSLNSRKDLFYPNSLHFNVRENELAALLISKHIIKYNLIDISAKKDKEMAIDDKLNFFKNKSVWPN
jgi:hypothetical protein